MPSYILKLSSPRGPRYLEYSTICDAPITYGMTLAAFKQHYKREYGASSMRDLEDRLLRVEATGSSSRIHDNLYDTIRCNRAGKGETNLTLEQLVDYYVVRQGKGKWPVGTKP